jgi:hypothetical protein
MHQFCRKAQKTFVIFALPVSPLAFSAGAGLLITLKSNAVPGGYRINRIQQGSK